MFSTLESIIVPFVCIYYDIIDIIPPKSFNAHKSHVEININIFILSWKRS